jgi:hypothetical protein
VEGSIASVTSSAMLTSYKREAALWQPWAGVGWQRSGHSKRTLTSATCCSPYFNR